METGENILQRLRRPSGERGFTLVELLVVITIIALIMCIVGPRVLNYLTESKAKAAKIQIESFASALDLFFLDTGRYPNTSEGLTALVRRPGNINSWNGPYLKGGAVPADPPVIIHPELDMRVLLCALICSLISGVVFGLAPALQSLKTDLIPALKNAEAAGGKQRTLGRNALVMGQVALAMVLLIATGMMMDGFRKLLLLDPGFKTDHVLTMAMDTSLVRSTPQQSHDFYRDLAAIYDRINTFKCQFGYIRSDP